MPLEAAREPEGVSIPDNPDPGERRREQRSAEYIDGARVDVLGMCCLMDEA